MHVKKKSKMNLAPTCGIKNHAKMSDCTLKQSHFHADPFFNTNANSKKVLRKKIELASPTFLNRSFTVRSYPDDYGNHGHYIALFAPGSILPCVAVVLNTINFLWKPYKISFKKYCTFNKCRKITFESERADPLWTRSTTPVMVRDYHNISGGNLPVPKHGSILGKIVVT